MLQHACNNAFPALLMCRGGTVLAGKLGWQETLPCIGGMASPSSKHAAMLLLWIFILHC